MYPLKKSSILLSLCLVLHSTSWGLEANTKKLFDGSKANKATKLSETINKAETATNSYPTAILNRPFTMPRNSFQFDLSLKAGNHNNNTSFYSLNGISLAYGVTNDFEVGVSWGGFAVSDAIDQFTPEQSVAINAGYFMFAVPHLAAMASLSLPLHFDSEVVKTTSFAMPTAVGLVDGTLSILLFYSDLVKFYWREDTAGKKSQFSADFKFPFKISYQITDALFTSLSTDLATVSTDGSYTHIGMETPLNFGLLYAINPELDIRAEAGFSDVQKWRNTFSVVAGVSYRFGNLQG